MRKRIQKVLKCRTAAVTTIFERPIITQEWILFGRFKICKTIKAA